MNSHLTPYQNMRERSDSVTTLHYLVPIPGKSSMALSSKMSIMETREHIEQDDRSKTPKTICFLPALCQPLSNSKVYRIEQSLKNDFDWYYCLVYFQLIISILMIIYDFVPLSSAKVNKDADFLQWLTGLCMAIACLLVLAAKKTLKSKKFKMALWLFYLALVFGFLEGLIDVSEQMRHYSKQHKNLPFIMMIILPIDLILDIVVISKSDKIMDLMIEREQILRDKDGDDIELQSYVKS